MTELEDPTISARTLLRWQLQRAHRLLDAAIDGLPASALHRRPAGRGVPIGASYAQVVVCEDLTVSGVLAARVPLALSAWAGRTGLSDLPLLARSADWHPWAHRVRIDLPALRPYARAVYAATDAYLAGLPDEALDPRNDAAPARLLTAILLTVAMRRGQIACLLALECRPSADTTTE
jgi:hypothetical protein